MVEIRGPLGEIFNNSLRVLLNMRAKGDEKACIVTCFLTLRGLINEDSIDLSRAHRRILRVEVRD